MEITHLSSLFNLGAAMICFIAAGRMIFSVNKRENISVNVKYYMYALIFVATYLLAGGMPAVFIEDSYLIALTASFFRPFLLFGGMFFALTPINLSGAKVIESFYVYVIMIIAFFSSVLSFMGIRDIGKDYFVKTFNYLGDLEYLLRPDSIFNSYSMVMVGIFFSISLLFATVFYIHFAFKQKKDDIAFGRAVMMAIGCFMFMSAGLSSYIFGLNPLNFLLTSITSSLLFMMGSVAFIASVSYNGEKNKLVKN